MILNNKNGPALLTADMRILYSLLLYILLPGVLLRLWWKSRRQPAYRRYWGERLGFTLPSLEGVVWVHAVSVGEVRAAAALIEVLMAMYPSQPLLVTTTTPTGRETVAQLFDKRVVCVYLPYDMPGAVRRFLRAFKPRLALFVEVEWWPNMFATLAAAGIPAYVVNARLSERSFRGYRKAGGLMRSMLAKVTHIAAQTEADKQRFIALGARPETISVTGNLKLDARRPADYESRVSELRLLTGAGREVWLAASTHPGEEAQVLQAHEAVLSDSPGALLILVPRHPERAAELAELCRKSGFRYQLFSDGDPIDPACRVMLVDTIGLLAYCYAIAPVAFIGGSLVDCGGHNPVEAVLAGSAVVSGPFDANFRDIYNRLRQADGVRQVAAANRIAAAVLELFNDPGLRQRQTEQAARVLEESRGALKQTLSLLPDNLTA